MIPNYLVLHDSSNRYQVSIRCLIDYFTSTGQSVLRCSQGSPPKDIKYHFTAACKQSSLKAIAAKSFSTVQECKQLANKNHAFAINFAHKALLHPVALNFNKETCIIYECPEFSIRQSEQANSVYDYYSSYARPSPKANVSCIPKVGVFQIHRERKSFSNAEKACENEGGQLADITSDLHTTHLSSLISSLNVSVAYVGLKQWNESQDDYLTSQGLPLSCLKFRAWAPNEPRPIPQTKCVLVTSNGYWKVKDCEKKHPFLCELKREGPMQPCRRIKHTRRRKRCLKTYFLSLPRKNRRPKCGDPDRKIRQDRREARRRRKQRQKPDNSTIKNY
uniref:Secretory phospholipase A2 receptor n=1 Tax=Lygus hesperus TaxID=30085 RepID=A0A146L2F6_LYGHE